MPSQCRHEVELELSVLGDEPPRRLNRRHSSLTVVSGLFRSRGSSLNSVEGRRRQNKGTPGLDDMSEREIMSLNDKAQQLLGVGKHEFVFKKKSNRFSGLRRLSLAGRSSNQSKRRQSTVN